MAYTPLYVGQTWPPLHVTLRADSGDGVSLANGTITLSIRNVTLNTIALGAGTVTITDSVNGHFDYQWASADTAVAGVYELQFTILFPGGTVTITDPVIGEIKSL